MATIADHLRLRVYLLKRAVVSWIRREREAFHRAFEMRSFRVWWKRPGREWSKFDYERHSKYQALLLTLQDSSPSVEWEVRFEPDDIDFDNAFRCWWANHKPKNFFEWWLLATMTPSAVLIWHAVLFL